MQPPASSLLNDAQRARSLARVTEKPVDIIVIGGGITGAGVALDAASRGFSVALLEARDLASGTSGFSSKLVHGGLRYLAKGDLGLAWESALERRYLMARIAPHLTRPLGFLVPRTAGSSRLETALTALGVRLADLLRRASGLSSAVLPRPRVLGPAATRELIPALPEAGLRGGLLYWDGQVEDDARLVIAVARTAAAHGAQIIRDARVLSCTETTAEFEDTRTGTRHSARARVVINATGVWADTLTPGLGLSPSRGTHLVLDAAALGNPRAAFTIPVPGKFGRFLFVLPQPGGVCYLGLTDEADPRADGYAPHIPEEDERFLLGLLGDTLGAELPASAILGRFAGLRPLVGAGGATADVSRHHLLVDRPGQPIGIIGGKLTTYRRMAEDAVDAAAERLGRRRPCGTRKIVLVGGGAGRGDAADTLARRYGTEATTIRELIRADPGLGEPVAPGVDYRGAEVIFALRAEGAHRVEDILERRTRLAFTPAAARAAEPRIRELLEAARAGD